MRCLVYGVAGLQAGVNSSYIRVIAEDFVGIFSLPYFDVAATPLDSSTIGGSFFLPRTTAKKKFPSACLPPTLDHPPV